MLILTPHGAEPDPDDILFTHIGPVWAPILLNNVKIVTTKSRTIITNVSDMHCLCRIIIAATINIDTTCILIDGVVKSNTCYCNRIFAKIRDTLLEADAKAYIITCRDSIK